MHLDEEQLERLRHGELSSQAERSAREHVSGCPDCSRRLAEAEREETEVHAMLRVLDDPPPRIRPEELAASAGAEAADARARDLAWLRRAAVIALAVGIAGAAYAIPGSPVRRWVQTIIERIGDRGTSDVAPGPHGSQNGVSGIAVAPGTSLLILFQSPQAGGQILVSLIDGTEVQVRAPAEAATFASSADQLRIDNRRAATFEIRIPHDAPRVEIQSGGRQVFLKEGSAVTTSGSVGPDGSYLLQLTPSRP